jgi:hypothetical protein
LLKKKKMANSPGFPVIYELHAVTASAAVFFAGLAISSAYYFSGRPIHFSDAVISNFLSPVDNPRGYLAASAGTALAGLVLAPTALSFFRRMGAIHRRGSLIATIFYAAGILAAIAIGCLAPVREIDFSVHLFLAYAAFMSLQAGISVYLTVSAYSAKSRGRTAFAVVEWVLAILVFAVSFGPDWQGSAAFCEWSLCATIAAGLWVLASWCS